jgi:hypothetical protein
MLSLLSLPNDAEWCWVSRMINPSLPDRKQPNTMSIKYSKTATKKSGRRRVRGGGGVVIWPRLFTWPVSPPVAGGDVPFWLTETVVGITGETVSENGSWVSCWRSEIGSIGREMTTGDEDRDDKLLVFGSRSWNCFLVTTWIISDLCRPCCNFTS